MATLADLYPGRAVLVPGRAFGVIKRVDGHDIYVQVSGAGRQRKYAAAELQPLGRARRKPAGVMRTKANR